MKIVILDGYTENPGDLSWKSFEELGDTVVYDRTPYLDSNEEIIRRAKGSDVVLVNKTPLRADTLRALSPELRYIGILATGYNVVDVEAAARMSVPVSNVPSYGTTAVAQFVMALLLELCHHVGEHSRSVKRGEWSNSPDFCYWLHPLIELRGKTLGIIGYGRIGHAVAELAMAFGMKVIAVSASVRKDGTVEMVSLDELLARSDVISLHCPLNQSTEGIINAQSIQNMKDKVMLINTARGHLINENDLAAALMGGKVSGAALDVLSVEPPLADNPLLCIDNCLITPHIAWAPQESRQRLMDIAVDNLRTFLAGKPQNVVNGVVKK